MSQPTFAEVAPPQAPRTGTITIRYENFEIEIADAGRAMIGDVSKAEHVYIACGYMDMRKSIDGLSALVIQQF